MDTHLLNGVQAVVDFGDHLVTGGLEQQTQRMPGHRLLLGYQDFAHDWRPPGPDTSNSYSTCDDRHPPSPAIAAAYCW
ncbi:hypothetical protein D3C78_895350 [compost metagenome]